ncbi:MAG: hypothetical protein GX496_09750 [Firmicutes bacterium]|nr:hypothetical protein [Bacillota bacterium]
MAIGGGEGFVDIHHHLLPGLDDGPRDWGQALELAREAARAGIRTVVATPHVRPGRPGPPTRAAVVERVDELRSRLASEGVELEVLPGAEVYPVPDLPRWLAGEGGASWELGQGSQVRYLLLDLPFDRLPPNFDRLIFEVALAGVTPVIAHPERNRQLAERPQLLAPLVEQGAVVQVTAGSLVGGFGREAQQAGLWLVRRGLARVVATDAHDVVRRSPLAMREAWRHLSRHVGVAMAEHLCIRWPLQVARGEPLDAASPVAGAAPEHRVPAGVRGLARGLRAWWERMVSSV